MSDDGQHRSYGSGAPGSTTGQRSKLEPGAHVGNECGPALNMRVPKTSCDADISTTSMSGGDGPHLKHNSHRADDQK